jgi:hypothetical protein
MVLVELSHSPRHIDSGVVLKHGYDSSEIAQVGLGHNWKNSLLPLLFGSVTPDDTIGKELRDMNIIANDLRVTLVCLGAL